MFFFTEIAKRVCREFHIQDEEILQLLMADNSDGEDDLDEKKIPAVHSSKCRKWNRCY